MHALYNFHFLNTVSQQLVAELEQLPVTLLDASHLNDLGSFQQERGAMQGVYVLHYDGKPVYLGKANNVRDRLDQHLRKLSGRQNIDLSKVGYKALLLDQSMSTAANESVLIRIFQQRHSEMWNSQGFGAKDPGRNRDNTVPNRFDSNYPIRADHPIHLTKNKMPVGQLLNTIKQQVPFVFRFNLEDKAGLDVDLRDLLPNATGEVPAQELLQHAVSTLGAGWKAAILSHGMVLYRTNANYRYGREILP